MDSLKQQIKDLEAVLTLARGLRTQRGANEVELDRLIRENEGLLIIKKAQLALMMEQ